ncbi:dipeptide epimerase [Pseudokordiimonas caeni]|uniref:dipeptide epimerase n=1 Tax=Pseudokordiimonas caeni TaxID=2997908 RepID=UPI002811781D|nr:dipeptide epimerase [Pseudokordiimonas caeni]
MMQNTATGPLKVGIEKVSFPLKKPFTITGHTFTETDAVHVTLMSGGVSGRGEGNGVYYLGDTVEGMMKQLEEVAPLVERGLSHESLLDILPAGGARNALDCAYWDLTAKQTGVRVWDRLNIPFKTRQTFFTIGIGSADEMAKNADAAGRYPNIKIKLDADDPVGKLAAIRRARPDARLIIDVNQGWSFDELKEYAPACAHLGIAMIEQPLPRGGDEALEGYRSPVPLGADESCLDAGEYATAAQRYDVINIKLDKCGGLSAGLTLAGLARRDGKQLMVGNMTGSSLSMAPSYVIAQFCDFVDIDGPLLLAADVDAALAYGPDGTVEVPPAALWG